MGQSLDVPRPDHGYTPVVVLVRPHHPGNIGAVARIMGNLGLTDLILLDPEPDHLGDEARSRAKWSATVLEEAKVCGTWEEVVEDLGVVIGTSGKREVGKKTLLRNFVQPWEVPERYRGSDTRVGLVFGTEGVGLTNEELLQCDFLLSLPTWEGYPILNLSHAVTVVLWELHRDLVQRTWGRDAAFPATMPLERGLDGGARAALRVALERFAHSLTGPEVRRSHLVDCLTRVVFRGAPTDQEAHRLIGAFIEATSALDYAQEDPAWARKRVRRLEQVPHDEDA